MDNQANKASVHQSDFIDSDNYERGLRILARIIARSLLKQQAKNKQAAIRSQTSDTPESSP